MPSTRNTVKLTLSKEEVRVVMEAAYPDLDLRGTHAFFTMQGGQENQYDEDDSSLTLHWVLDVVLEDNE